MKDISIVIALFLAGNNFAFAQEDSYSVQVGAFVQEVPISYFEGVSGIFHVVDKNEIHEYYIGEFGTIDEANWEAIKLEKKGYHTTVVKLETILSSCVSGSVGVEEEEIKQIELKPIFFDYDRSGLRVVSKRQLDLLYAVLKKHPNCNARISAHTGSKKSNSYNRVLSLRRAEAAKTYLIYRGISASRLVTSTFGQSYSKDNSWKNNIDGEDGRRMDRRVELAIYRPDGKMAEVFNEIIVPEQLQPESMARLEE